MILKDLTLKIPFCDGSKYFLSIDENTNTGYDQLPDIIHEPMRTNALITKGILASIVPMTADQYLTNCSKARGHKPAIPENEYAAINPGKIDDIAEKMKNGNKFPIPIINYAYGNQDGRHRALAALKIGVKRIPVIVIDFCNENQIRKIIDYPKSWNFFNGIMIDKGTGKIIADLRSCKDIDEANSEINTAKTLFKPVLNEQLSIDIPQHVQTFLDGLNSFSSQCYINENSDKIECTVDKDNNTTIRFVQGLADDYINRYGVFVSGIFDVVEPLSINNYNGWQIIADAEKIYNFEDFKKLNKHRNNYPRSNLDQYCIEQFLNIIKERFVYSEKFVKNQRVITIGSQASKLVICIDNTMLSIQQQYTNYFFGNIDITAENVNRYVDRYQKLVKQFNIKKDLNSLLKFLKPSTSTNNIYD